MLHGYHTINYATLQDYSFQVSVHILRCNYKWLGHLGAYMLGLSRSVWKVKKLETYLTDIYWQWNTKQT